MHGQQWHDHAQPKDFEPEAMAGAGAILGEPIEGSPNNSVEGMGRFPKGAETSRGGVKRKRKTPIGKQHKSTKPAQGARTGKKGRNRAGNPG